MGPPLSVATISNIVVLFGCLLVAVTATSEIVTRNEDYGRVLAHQKALIACQTGTAPPGTDCPRASPDDYKTSKLEEREAAARQADAKAVAFWVEVATTQVRRYNSLNSLGAPDRCHVAAVIASQIGHFWEDCQTVLTAHVEGIDLNKEVELQLKLRAHAKAVEQAKAEGRPPPEGPPEPRLALSKPENRTLIKAMLAPTLPKFAWPRVDEWPKEPLYFLLVLVSAAIGSLIGGLRSTAFTTHRDITLGVGAGFAVYILLRGGNFVFFTGGTSIDVLNPFTASAVGLLVGLFNEKAFGLLGNAMPTALSRPAPTPAASPEALKNAQLAQTNAVAAAKKTYDAAVEAVKKSQPGSEAQKALQDMATAALDAKTKAEEAAKAQGEAARIPAAG